MNNQYQVGDTVQYSFDRYTRTGEVVEYNAETNRYRVYWHTETSDTSETWVGHPNKRTWVKADALKAVQI